MPRTGESIAETVFVVADAGAAKLVPGTLGYLRLGMLAVKSFF